MRFTSIRCVFCLQVLIVSMVMGLTGCTKEYASMKVKSPLEIPMGFPEVFFPTDNEFSRERWELGKMLFFDPVLSRDSSISCASCHKPEFAFADNRSTSPGIENRSGKRNSPSLANVGYFPYLLREGGVPTLEMQVLVPIDEHNEFDFNIVDLSVKLAHNAKYAQLAKEAYNREIDPFVITRAIATFERSLISGTSPYDKFVNGDQNVLNREENSGRMLFFSERTKCTSCHGGMLFTDHSFQNNGLYLNYTDSGRLRLTGEGQDRALFKVPSLRNVGLTAPYMHDGKMESLIAVVNHYNRGGYDHVNKSELVQPLGLSFEEKKALVAFLKTLSDFEFINDKRWD